MNNSNGVHSVDFKIFGSGHGCVNWNGSMELTGDNGMVVKNHSLPKLRGFSNLSGKVSENGFKYKKHVGDIDAKENPMYISSNCFKHHVFRDSMPFHLGKPSASHALELLKHPTGLLRGYAMAITGTPLMKKSPFLMEDIYDQLGNLNYEVLSTASSKQSDTGGFYTKTTVGNTKYIGFGSLNVEELQFISCDGIFGRSAVGLSISEADVVKLSNEISKNLQEIGMQLGVMDSNHAIAEYNQCWVRKNSVMNIGEAGIKLNNKAIDVLVEYFKDLLNNLYIHQARGHVKIDSVLYDYNDGVNFRIKEDELSIQQSITNRVYADYYRKGDDNEINNSNAERAALGT